MLGAWRPRGLGWPTARAREIFKAGTGVFNGGCSVWYTLCPPPGEIQKTCPGLRGEIGGWFKASQEQGWKIPANIFQVPRRFLGWLKPTQTLAGQCFAPSAKCVPGTSSDLSLVYIPGAILAMWQPRVTGPLDSPVKRDTALRFAGNPGNRW